MQNTISNTNDAILVILYVHNFVLMPEEIKPTKENNAINSGSKSKNSIPLADESFDKRSISVSILTKAATTPYKAYKETRKNIIAKIRLNTALYIIIALFDITFIY